MNVPINMTVSKTYSLPLTYIGKVSDMTARTSAKSESEIVRAAIDFLWDALEADPSIAARIFPTPPTAQ